MIPKRSRVHSDFPVTKVKNGQVLVYDRLDSKFRFVKKDLCFQAGVIVNDQELFYKQSTRASEISGLREDIIDAKGGYIVPGFIDIQINGGGGVDFSDPNLSQSDLEKVGKLLVSHGCTSYVPTMVTSPPEVYKRNLPILGVQQFVDLPEILGCHVEGPFISKSKKGAHEEKFMKQPSHVIPQGGSVLDGLRTVYGDDLSNIKWITLAPELDGAQDAIVELVKQGIIVSCGHTEARIEDMEMAITNGATLITHLFNAMTSFDHRGPGVIGVLGSPKELKSKIRYGIIVDGIHSHPYSVHLANNTHPEGMILITDAIAALGLPAGKYLLGTKKVNVGKVTLLNGKETLKATLEDSSSTLAGSIVSMIDCVNNTVEFIGGSLVDAVVAASVHPAHAMNVHDRKGYLSEGYDADFVILHENLYNPNSYVVHKTFIKGIEAYRDDTTA